MRCGKSIFKSVVERTVLTNVKGRHSQPGVLSVVLFKRTTERTTERTVQRDVVNAPIMLIMTKRAFTNFLTSEQGL